MVEKRSFKYVWSVRCNRLYGEVFVFVLSLNLFEKLDRAVNKDF